MEEESDTFAFDEPVKPPEPHSDAAACVCASVNYAIDKAPVYPEFHRVAQSDHSFN